MALLAIKRGPSNKLANQKAKEGQIIFAPDTGYLYIDIAGDGTTIPVIAKSTTANSGANRIRIGGPTDGLDYSFTVNGIQFNATADKDAGTIKTQYGGTGNTTFTANKLIFSESATKLSSASNIYVTHSGIAINSDHITSGYVFEVNGQSRFYDILTIDNTLIANKKVLLNDKTTANILTATTLSISNISNFYDLIYTKSILPFGNNQYDLGSNNAKYKNIYGSLKGNADTATEFATATTVALTGVITGTSSASKRGWSISTSIGNAKITNDMLAGNITNSKLINPFVQLSGHTVYLGDNIDLTDLLPDLGLDSATHFVGHAMQPVTDGGSEDPGIEGYTIDLENEIDDRKPGDIIIASNSNDEYIWTKAGKWERFGREGVYKTLQTALGIESSTTNKWVGAIHQNANGELDRIIYTELDTSGTWSGIAEKANKDSQGNVINTTYVTKNELAALDLALPETSGHSLQFIDTISQTDGQISATRRTVQDASESQAGVVNIDAQNFAGQKTFKDNVIFDGKLIGNNGAFFKNITVSQNLTALKIITDIIEISNITKLFNQIYTSTILPHKNNIYDIGSQTNKYKTIYADKFEGIAEKTNKSNGGSTINAVAYYSDASGTFGYISSGAGAFYSSGAAQQPGFGILPANLGGTGLNLYTKYDILYASSKTELSVLNAGQDGYLLATHGSSQAPTWIDPATLVSDAATRTSNTITQYGVAYYSTNTGAFASTIAGTAITALVGTTNGPPRFINISPEISQSTANDGSLALSIKVLDVDCMTALTLTSATTSVYGVTLLQSALYKPNTQNTKSDSQTTAATPKMVWDAIGTLNRTTQEASGHTLQFVADITQVDGQINVSRSTVQEASDTNPGIVTISGQTFAGDKTFNGVTTLNKLIVNSSAIFNNDVTLVSKTAANNLVVQNLIVNNSTKLFNNISTGTILPHSTNISTIGKDNLVYAAIYASTLYGVATKANAANIATHNYGLAMYVDGNGTFGQKSTGKGAFYCASAMGEPAFGILDVIYGGTGAETFSSGELLIGNGTNAVGTRAILNNTTVGSLGWSISATTETNLYVLNRNTLAYWNGAYQGSGTQADPYLSNLTILGTVTKGEWTATTVAIAYGGTGSTSFTKNRLVWTGSDNQVSSLKDTVDIYVSNASMTINGNTAPSAGVFEALGNVRVSSSQNAAGGDISLELWRGTNASWKFLNSGGKLSIQNNFTTTIDSYFDVLTMDYNSGNITIKKGDFTTKKIIPDTTETYDIGASNKKYSTIYSTTFNGSLDGTISVTNTAIANNDTLVFIDSSNGNKITASNIKFDGSTTNKFLSQKGTWEQISITLNGSASSSPSFYAPISNGSQGQYLMANTSGVPTWSTIETTDTKNTVGNSVSTSTIYLCGTTSTSNASTSYAQSYVNANVYMTNGALYASQVHNAIWNDYAEFRVSEVREPGRVIVPTNMGVAILSDSRMQPNGKIISDTYGSSVGKSDQAKTPVCLMGRVLAFPYRSIDEYHIGDCVCTAPNGTVDIMTREEIKEYPDRILGIVNEIPNYKVWKQTFTNNSGFVSEYSVQVNGRIWIDVK